MRIPFLRKKRVILVTYANLAFMSGVTIGKNQIDFPFIELYLAGLLALQQGKVMRCVNGF